MEFFLHLLGVQNLISDSGTFPRLEVEESASAIALPLLRAFCLPTFTSNTPSLEETTVPTPLPTRTRQLPVMMIMSLSIFPLAFTSRPKSNSVPELW